MISAQGASRRTALRLLAGAAVAGVTAPALAAAIAPWQRLICVDLDRALLHVVEGASVTLVSRVIVGMPTARTPFVSSHLTHVRFRPSWSPTKTSREQGGYPDRLWPPGPENPLGLATVHFDGGGGIYLHGTNQPDLFRDSDRRLSYGCVRVERLEALIAWILDWPAERTRGAMEGKRSFAVRTPEIPLLIAHAEREPLFDMLAQLAERWTTSPS